MIASVRTYFFRVMARGIGLAREARIRPALALFVGLLLIGGSAWGPVLGSGLVWVQNAAAETPPAPKSLEKLTIMTAGGEKVFQVEVMRTMDERARGLMFRRYLPADRGMLFDFAVEAQVAMWMKDTFIPLDMLFIRKDGTISQIAENTEPHSTRTISSTDPVYAVLEINGGLSAKLGLKPGDRIVHPLFASR
jgi:uncharacterized membrane protein (UPF0127 family)